MIKCVCIDATNKPVIIPFPNWVIKDEEYHIIHVGRDNAGVLTVSLKEVQIPKECYPYQGYRGSRFAIDVADLPKFMEFLADCAKADRKTQQELFEELGVEVRELEEV